MSLARAGPRIDGANAIFVDDDDLARGDVTDELSLDEIEGASLAGEDVRGAGITTVRGWSR